MSQTQVIKLKDAGKINMILKQFYQPKMSIKLTPLQRIETVKRVILSHFHNNYVVKTSALFTNYHHVNSKQPHNITPA